MPQMSDELKAIMSNRGIRENLSASVAAEIWALITRDGVSAIWRTTKEGRHYIFCPASRAENHKTRESPRNYGSG